MTEAIEQRFAQMSAVVEACIAEREAFDAWWGAGSPHGELRNAYVRSGAARVRAVADYIEQDVDA